MEFIKKHKIYSGIIILTLISYIRDAENIFALQLLTLTTLLGLLFFLDIKHKYRNILHQSILILAVIIFIAKIYINGHYIPNLPTFDTGDELIPDTRGSNLPFIILFLIDYSMGLIFTLIALGFTNYIRLNDPEGAIKSLNPTQQKEFIIIISIVISLVLIKSVYMLS